MFHPLRTGLLTLAGVATVGLGASAASAGSLVLGDSGWTASWASSRDSQLSLNVDAVSNGVVFIEKKLDYNEGRNSFGFFDPVVITFQQTRADAVPFIALNDEQVINNSGENWDNFRMTLLGAQFDTSRSDAFTVNPFTDQTYSVNDSILDIAGGPGVADGDTWFHGSAPIDDNALFVINPIGSDDTLGAFSLKEQPNAGGSPPPVVIPLPASVWTGLSGLGGLLLLGGGKKFRRVLA
jgi:hypothetical protein